MRVEIRNTIPSLYSHKNQQLLKTTCSTDLEDNDSPSPEPTKGRKRVGRYSFRLKDLIGTGYSSKVYKGVREDSPGQFFAVKAVRLRGMAMTNSYLLNSEVQIMQGLEHPNIVKLVEVLYTANHCYLITEYCEGGTLDRYSQNKESVEWGKIICQLAQGCRYLANKNIVHRDLKPANIFLKQGQWKIGDFGFAKQLPSSDALIMEGFRVGSPLFMPLETLQRSMYSAKSDSFALGVIIYFLITKEYPWEGTSLNKLIRNCKEKCIDWSKFELLPNQITTILQGLLSLDMKSRVSINSCDFSIFQGQKSLSEMESALLLLCGKVKQQVVLCQFIHYLINNSMIFLQDGDSLYSLMSNHLYHLTQLYQWESNKSLTDIKKNYILPQGKVKITANLYRKILALLRRVINRLKQSERSVEHVSLEKLLEYYHICKLTVKAQGEELSIFLNSLILYKNFKDLLPNKMRLASLMSYFEDSQ